MCQKLPKNRSFIGYFRKNGQSYVQISNFCYFGSVKWVPENVLFGFKLLDCHLHHHSYIHVCQISGQNVQFLGWSKLSAGSYNIDRSKNNTFLWEFLKNSFTLWCTYIRAWLLSKKQKKNFVVKVICQVI